MVQVEKKIGQHEQVIKMIKIQSPILSEIEWFISSPRPRPFEKYPSNANFLNILQQFSWPSPFLFHIAQFFMRNFTNFFVRQTNRVIYNVSSLHHSVPLYLYAIYSFFPPSICTFNPSKPLWSLFFIPSFLMRVVAQKIFVIDYRRAQIIILQPRIIRYRNRDFQYNFFWFADLWHEKALGCARDYCTSRTADTNLLFII